MHRLARRGTARQAALSQGAAADPGRRRHHLFRPDPLRPQRPALRGVPRLTERDRSALAAFEKAIWDDELVVRLRQEPGDMVFINNHYHVHARSTFKDLEDPAEKRHLRRLWLETDAWAAQRPVAMSTFLHAARSFWEKPGSSVQMWDHM
ncbi:MAG: TauD/TfdA family dioxygenase [Gammaproteobacteria bacterium]|nr:TauD/TfdA family dioxygenase [Gammaproteobacteria bacterium]